MNEPTHRFQKFLHEEKKEYSFKGEEPVTKKIRTEVADFGGYEVYAMERELAWKDDDDLKTYFKRYWDAYLKLGEFYNSPKMRKARWDFQKAQRAEFDKATHAILQMAGASINKRILKEDRKKKPEEMVVFVLGNAEFQSKTTTHTSFERYFVRKVRSLGYPVIWVNERYTSQRCPSCQDVNNTVQAMNMRVKYCRTCWKWLHRDNMAAENMVQIGRECIKNGGRAKRPSYLEKSPSKMTDNNRRGVTILQKSY